MQNHVFLVSKGFKSLLVMLFADSLTIRQRWLLQKTDDLHLLNKIRTKAEETNSEQPDKDLCQQLSSLVLGNWDLHVLKFDVRRSESAAQLEII